MVRLPFFLARGFVAAETMAAAMPVIIGAHKTGLLTTVDLLGEHVKNRRLAAAARDQYVQLLYALAAEHAAHGVEVNISIKLSMMGQIIDEDLCYEHLRSLLTVAREVGGFVRLDMENSTILESTLRLFDAVYPEFPKSVGIVLQAYLKRTRDDVERMCDLGARVRLCKGAYREPSRLAYQRMSEIRTRFVECMQVLLRRGHYPAIATHDDRLIRATQSFAKDTGLGADTFEFQMLYGMRPRRQQQLAASGYNMRVYIPYGNMWLPYYSRRLRERPENITFLLRNIFRR